MYYHQDERDAAASIGGLMLIGGLASVLILTVVSLIF